ncbi:MAG: GntR family transcriptional regulator [Verrucomicrobiaceae bacterium]|nr:GntR family transcriptional regulator [Verrucomicrobiaceae bacterium]
MVRGQTTYHYNAMRFPSVNRSTTLVEDVCALITRESRKAPGADEWLPPERQLAEKLCVSRQVVREATKRLELQGILEVCHGVGTRVVNRLHSPLNRSFELLMPDRDDRFTKLTEMRVMVEPQLASLAASRASHEDLQAMRLAQSNLESAETQEAAVLADMEFHRALAKAAGNPIAELMLESLAELGKASRSQTIGMVGKAPALAHHATILEAIEARKPDTAAKAMAAHLGAIELHLLKETSHARPKKPLAARS